MLNLYTFCCTFCPHEDLERPSLNSPLKIIKHVCCLQYLVYNILKRMQGYPFHEQKIYILK